MAHDNSQIIAAASHARIAQYRWANRGRAPAGFISGMAVSFAEMYRELLADDPIARVIAEPRSGNPSADVLEWYAPQLDAAGLPGDSPEERLIQITTILLGLGMRESSGKHCEGRDMSTTNVSAETAEAGLFQVSYNSINGHPLLRPLIAKFRGRKDLLEVFDDGVHCQASSWHDWGTGPGVDFQELTKECPAFAVRYAAVLLRVQRRHWGPINRHEAEVRADAGLLLNEIKAIVDAE